MDIGHVIKPKLVLEYELIERDNLHSISFEVLDGGLWIQWDYSVNSAPYVSELRHLRVEFRDLIQAWQFSLLLLKCFSGDCSNETSPNVFLSVWKNIINLSELIQWKTIIPRENYVGTLNQNRNVSCFRFTCKRWFF